MRWTEGSKLGGIFNRNLIFTQNIRPYFGKNKYLKLKDLNFCRTREFYIV